MNPAITKTVLQWIVPTLPLVVDAIPQQSRLAQRVDTRSFPYTLPLLASLIAAILIIA